MLKCKPKHIPTRKCIACGKRENKDVLLRIVRVSKKNSPTQTFILGDLNNRSGRGYYLCKDIKCLEIAISKKRLERIFKHKVTDTMYQILKDGVQNTK